MRVSIDGDFGWLAVSDRKTKIREIVEGLLHAPSPTRQTSQALSGLARGA